MGRVKLTAAAADFSDWQNHVRYREQNRTRQGCRLLSPEAELSRHRSNGELDKKRLGIEKCYSKILKNKRTVNNVKKSIFLGMESEEN